MGIKKRLSNIIRLLKETFSHFIDDNGMKLSAALSYYTIFSLPPLLILIISLTGFFFGEEAVRGELFGQINGLVGNEVAHQIQEAVRNISLSGNSTFATVIGFGVLLIGASRVFAEIQESINYIWGLKAKPEKGLIKFLFNRLVSFSMIGTVGFLLLVSLLVNTLMDVMYNKLSVFFPADLIYLFYVLNVGVVFLIITFLFVIIFKALPDATVAFKDCFIGAAFTAVLFMLGKFAISAYLGSSMFASIYGAAGSVILILLWVYYSAMILYFGAEFTKVYAILHGQKIVPNEFSVLVIKDHS
ncbi:MAG: YihY/virulence factor BrkB family protein [Bacteroidetes bacterium]|nr:MAG: YihY/virulence factor BrkB family protein [Bacteroidota bacterium]REK04876.1 MAG: YihY/virulence factor BrkB family protein [Bacteroidota bacterium]REK36348.1 MAG: YihY/virulence factor BrkB family protein [Bacteroidota bacterium]REK50986.1 MAG: YihY/virulence factor BrkB family protein [Bacteroidota bacterium]